MTFRFPKVQLGRELGATREVGGRLGSAEQVGAREARDIHRNAEGVLPEVAL